MDLLRALRDASPPKEMAFPLAEYEARVARVRQAMARRGLEVLLLHNPASICYLNGYSTPMGSWYACLALPVEGEPFMQVMEGETAVVYIHGWVDVIERVPWQHARGAPGHLAQLLEARGYGRSRIGLELARYPLAARTVLELQASLTGASFVDASDLMSGLRVIKSPAEMRHIQQAAAYSAQALRAVESTLKPGISRREVLAIAYGALVQAGSEHPAYPPRVLVGGAARPIASDEQVLAEGQAVCVRVAGVHHRYQAPQATTSPIGAPPPLVMQLKAMSQEILSGLLAAARPGVPLGEAGRAALRHVAALPKSVEANLHLGQSIGIGIVPAWQEGSLVIASDSARPFEAGMVFYSAVELVESGVAMAENGMTWRVTPEGAQAITVYS